MHINQCHAQNPTLVAYCNFIDAIQQETTAKKKQNSGKEFSSCASNFST